MTTYRTRQPGQQPVVIGADLIQEARLIERQMTLLAVRKAVEKIPTRERKTMGAYGLEDLTANEFLAHVRDVLDVLEAGS